MPHTASTQNGSLNPLRMLSNIFQYYWESYLFIRSRCSNLTHYFLFQFSPILTSSCGGQGQNKGQSNPLCLLHLCKLKVDGNILFLSVTKEPRHVHPLSYPLKEKVEYVSPWYKVCGHNDSNPPL